MIKKNIVNENTIKCKDCMNSFDPDNSNLSFETHEPMLSSCKHSKHQVLYSSVDKKCQYSNPKQKKL